MRILKSKEITLDQIPLQTEAQVVALKDSSSSVRFMELGVSPGVKVKILFFSPGGNLAALFLDDSFCLSLRKEDLNKIVVTPSSLL